MVKKKTESRIGEIAEEFFGKIEKFRWETPERGNLTSKIESEGKVGKQ